MVSRLLILSILFLSVPAYAETVDCDAVCRYSVEKAQEDRDAIEAGKAAVTRWEAEQRREQARARRELRDAERILRMQAVMPMPMMFSCTSAQIGPFTNLDCF